MSRARTWIAILTVGHLVACSSTFKELSPTPSGGGEPSGKAGPFLNSPFFLALMSGVLIAGVTGLYSHLKASSDRKLAEDNARREKQTAVLSSVANDLPVYVSTMGSMRELKVWLEDRKNDDATFGEIGLPRKDVLKEYLEFYKLSLKTRSSVSVLMEVSSFYETPAVCEALNKEKGAIKTIDAAKQFDEVKKAGEAEEKSFDALLSAMAKELKETHRNGTGRGGRPCLDEIVVHSP